LLQFRTPSVRPDARAWLVAIALRNHIEDHRGTPDDGRDGERYWERLHDIEGSPDARELGSFEDAFLDLLRAERSLSRALVLVDAVEAIEEFWMTGQSDEDLAAFCYRMLIDSRPGFRLLRALGDELAYTGREIRAIADRFASEEAVARAEVTTNVLLPLVSRIVTRLAAGKICA
jgi:hypothetical protein